LAAANAQERAATPMIAVYYLLLPSGTRACVSLSLIEVSVLGPLMPELENQFHCFGKIHDCERFVQMRRALLTKLCRRGAIATKSSTLRRTGDVLIAGWQSRRAAAAIRLMKCWRSHVFETSGASATKFGCALAIAHRARS
jgi:hypothetical protein